MQNPDANKSTITNSNVISIQTDCYQIRCTALHLIPYIEIQIQMHKQSTNTNSNTYSNSNLISMQTDCCQIKCTALHLIPYTYM